MFGMFFNLARADRPGLLMRRGCAKEILHLLHIRRTGHIELMVLPAGGMRKSQRTRVEHDTGNRHPATDITLAPPYVLSPRMG